jgi:two-component system NtrC family sensor kinase
MPPASLPVDEAARLRALLEYDILDSPSEAAFDRITQMVGEILQVPIVLVSFVDRERQWFKSRFGFEGSESSRDSAFCAHTILGDDPLVVPDATLDPRFCDSPLVVGAPFIRFYAGIPLRSSSGHKLGTLCAICLEPRHMEAREVDLMVRFAAVVSDELALRLALKHLRENHERLLHSEKMAGLGRFAARLAHEINTPVHFLGGTTDFLRDSFQSLTTIVKAYESFRDSVRCSPCSEENAQNRQRLEQLIQEHDMGYLLDEVPVALEHASTGIARISDLVTSMRTLAHPASRPHFLADINEAIRTTAVISGSEWRPHSALELRLDPAVPLLPCDISEINQALTNLVVNASHAIEARIAGGDPTPGRILIETCRAGKAVYISIRDNGQGMPAEVMSKAYDLDFTTKPPGKGTGQGLAIVHDIVVQKHHGFIDLHSEPGLGTVFLLRLPLEPEVPTGDSDPFASLFSGG